MANPKLNVIIVGAGIAGLTCAVTLASYECIGVTVLDKSPRAQLIRHQGIQLPPNACLALRSSGLLDRLIALGTVAEGCFYMNYDYQAAPLNRRLADCEEVYGAPWIFVDHADLMKLLLEKAEALGVKMMFGANVENANFEVPSVKLGDGKKIKGDVVIAADGTDSKIRKLMHPTHPEPHSQVVRYRTMLEITDDFIDILGPSIAHLANSRIWLGHNADITLYPITIDQNLSLEITIADETSHREPEGLDLLERLKGWHPVVGSLIALAPGFEKEKMRYMEGLKTWNKGGVVLIGDAAHPMLPYLHQDIAMGVEDAVILGSLLGNLIQHTPSELTTLSLKPLISPILKAFELLQRHRIASVALQSRNTGFWNHLETGEMQQVRDIAFSEYHGEGSISESNIPWLDGLFNMGLLKRDAMFAARGEFEKLQSLGLYDVVEGRFRPPKRLWEGIE